MILLVFTLITGPVGDYIGYDYDYSIAYQGYDSLFSIIGDDGDTTVFDTVTIIDTLNYGGYPAYLNRHIRVSDIWSRNDTLFSWEVGDTLFTYITRDTVSQRTYVTPFYTGLQWDLDIAGETLIIDIDNDSIYDTLIVQSGIAEIIDSVTTTVPLGTFDVFKISSIMNLTGWQSFFNDSCRIWIQDWQWLAPHTGIIRDSVVIVDTVHQIIWLELLRFIMYSEAVDSGYTTIAEFYDYPGTSIQPVLNGIMISGRGNHLIDIYDISGRWVTSYDIYCDDKYKLKPKLLSGVYFAQVTNNEEQISVKFVVID
ncbi:MAG: T9SS type A sorting domain-containing protein [bacterium]